MIIKVLRLILGSPFLKQIYANLLTLYKVMELTWSDIHPTTNCSAPPFYNAFIFNPGPFLLAISFWEISVHTQTWVITAIDKIHKAKLV
jgi:hypothetical protein